MEGVSLHVVCVSVCEGGNKRMTPQEQGSLGGSCCALIDFSLVNPELDFISPGKKKKTANEGMAGTLVLFPARGQMSILLQLVIRKRKRMLWIQSWSLLPSPGLKPAARLLTSRSPPN